MTTLTSLDTNLQSITKARDTHFKAVNVVTLWSEEAAVAAEILENWGHGPGEAQSDSELR